jgi:alkylation response protein AidB-like acyl-CoA dehydrogenase
MTRPLDIPGLARALAWEVAATAAAHDRDGSFPAENFKRLQQAGLLALTAPTSLGGRGASLPEAAQVIGQIAQGEPSTALILAMQYINLATLPESRWPQHLVRRIVHEAALDGALINAFRVEPELGTPLRGGLPATTATRQDDGWSISGHKIYSTGSFGLTWAIVWARTDEATPRVGAFLVPMSAQGLAIEESWDQLGMRATVSHDVILDKVKSPLDHAVDIRPPEEWQGRDPQQTVWMAVLLGALYDGVARSARDWLVQFLQNRIPTSLGKPLATLPRMQEAVGDIERLLHANARLLASAARDGDSGRLDPNEAQLLKVTVTENAIAAVEAALRLTGNHGLARVNPLQRHLRDVLCGRVHSPQGDTVHLMAGRLALDA